MKANEIKKGVVIQVDAQKVFVKNVQVQSPSSRSGNTLYKVVGRNVVSRGKFERSFKGDENVEIVEFARRPVQLLYKDAQGVTFMDSESYEQYVVSESDIEEEMRYLHDQVEGVLALIADNHIIGIELPATLALEIKDCAPGIKGASAAARTKPATLSTGAVVQVPEYLSPGERIKVNTETGQYMSRA